MGAAEEPTLTPESHSKTLHRQQWLLLGYGGTWGQGTASPAKGAKLSPGVGVQFYPLSALAQLPSPLLSHSMLQRSHPGL